MPRHDEGFFSAKDNLRLFWQSDVPDNPRAYVALVHGYGEHCGRYRRTIDHLVAQGFAVYAFDYRGHGQSDGRRGHCDRFSDLVDDLELFWNRVREAAQGKKKAFILAHSHGGLMTLHLLPRQPSDLAGIVLSSPLLAIAVAAPPLKVFAAKLAGKAIPWLPVSTGIPWEDLTSDVQEQQAVARDPLYNRNATPRWFNEANAAMVEAMKLGPKISMPVLFTVAGEDKVASPQASRAFFETVASQDKTLKLYENMRHETLNEVGREAVLQEISGWISAHA